jgi:hypothetical protein
MSIWFRDYGCPNNRYRMIEAHYTRNHHNRTTANSSFRCMKRFLWCAVSSLNVPMETYLLDEPRISQQNYTTSKRIHRKLPVSCISHLTSVQRWNSAPQESLHASERTVRSGSIVVITCVVGLNHPVSVVWTSIIPNPYGHACIPLK